MDNQIDHLKEEVDFTDNNDKLDKLKKSYLILKQKVCRSHDLIKLYNDKLKECERIKIDLDLANKETKKMTTNYNLTLAKVIKLELQNAEYKKDIESLSSTIAAHETKMAGDKQHMQQLTCKMKELEETHMDKIMQLDLDNSLLQENIKELKCQLKASNKICDLSKRKCNKKQQNIDNDANSEGTISTVDVAVNTVSNAVSTVDVAVNTVGSNIKANSLIEKSIMTDISWNIDKNDLYPLFCNECESILSNPCDKICRSMTKHPQLIETISSPIKSLRTQSTIITERDENLTNSSGDTSANNNSSTSSTVFLKPELSLQDHHTTTPIPLSKQHNGLSTAVQTPCLISESNSLTNLATSTTSVLEKLEEKMKRLERRIKKQSRKKKQLPTNHLQYFPHMNCYPNDILGQNLSLNMASTFWNEVKNLMNDKQNKCAENQKKRYESKLCKFSSKKIKLKQRLKQNNISLHNNAWNVEPMAIDDSIETDHLKTETSLPNFSSKIKVDEDKCCSTLLEENTENGDLFSTSKKTSDATNMQDDESFELSLCEDIKDNISNSIEDTNSSDFNDTQCYTPAVKITTQQKNDVVSFTSKRLDTKNKNYFENETTDTVTTTAATTICTSTINTTCSNDTAVINNIVNTTSKASTGSTSATMNDKANESGTDKRTSISDANEFSNTEFSVEKLPEIVDNVSPNAKISNSIDKYKVNNRTTIAANSITIANTSPPTNFTTTITCLTNSIITTTNNVSTNCTNKNTTTTSVGIVTRAQKRKFEYNSQTQLSTVKKNNETACNVENNEICNDKIMEDTSEDEIDNKSDSLEDCISWKKQCMSNEVKSNQDNLTENLNTNEAMDDVIVPLAGKITDAPITHTNLNRSNNYIDNAFISKEGMSTEATITNSTDFITNVHDTEWMEEQSNNESAKVGHSNSIKNVGLHTKRKFGKNKTAQGRIMEHLKNLKTRSQSKISDLDLSHPNESITDDNQNNNQDKGASQVVHTKYNEIKNNEVKRTPRMLSRKNNETKQNEDKSPPQILCKKTTEIEHNEEKSTQQILCRKNTEMKNNEDNRTPQILCKKNNITKQNKYNKCAPPMFYTKNTEMEHNQDNFPPQILCRKNTGMENNEDKSPPQSLYKKNTEMEDNQDKSIPQILSRKNIEMENNEDNSIPQVLCKKNNKTKHSPDKSPSQILSQKNTEIEHNEDNSAPQTLCKKNNKTKHNEDNYISPILSSKNSEIINNITRSYSNLNRKEEYKLPSKSVDLNRQRSDALFLQAESEDEWSDESENDTEKNCNPVNAKEQTGSHKITAETQRFSSINGITKSNRIDFEIPTIITEIATCNENSIDNESQMMEIITSENTENIDNNAEIVSPYKLLENHLDKKKRPKGLRTTRKALKKMEDICKTTDTFVDKQLHRILSNCDWGMAVHTDVVNKLSSMCTVRIVANGIIEFMLDRAMHNLDKSYTPPAPLMTSVQQRITALLVDLEVKMPTVIKCVQIGIEYKIFRLNKTPMLHQVQNLIRLYVVLARIQKDREKVRILCCDALYCLGLHAIPVIYTVLTSWPEIFPQFSEKTEMLPKCMAHIIATFQAIDFPQLQPLKGLIANYYKFKAGNYVTINLMEELLNSLEANQSGTGICSLKTAIILLAKKEGTAWTNTKVIQGTLLPRIVNEKYSSIYEAFCLLGHLLRTFPVEKDNPIVKNITEQLSDLIESGEGSEDQQEGIISALLSLSRHNFEKVSESAMRWKPTKPMRAFTIDQYYALFDFRPSMHWRRVLKNKM